MWAATPLPTRSPRSVAVCSSHATSAVLPTPAAPATNRVWPLPAVTVSSRFASRVRSAALPTGINAADGLGLLFRDCRFRNREREFSSCGSLCLLEFRPDGDGRATRPDAQFLSEGALEPLELTQCGSLVPPRRHLADHPEVGFLVGGIDRGQHHPPFRQPEYIHVEPVQAIAFVQGPLRIWVLRQQFTCVGVGGLRSRRRIPGGDGKVGSCRKGERVDVHTVVRKEGNGLTVKYDRAGVTEGAPRIEGGLVKSRGGLVDVQGGPQHVHHLFPVQGMPGRQRQNLHECGGLTATPFGLVHRHAVHGDRECTQDSDVDIHGFGTLLPLDASPDEPAGSGVIVGFSAGAVVCLASVAVHAADPIVARVSTSSVIAEERFLSSVRRRGRSQL